MLKLSATIMMLLQITVFVNAQSDVGANPFLNDANGRPLYLKTNYTADGSPFLFESYLPATLKSADGKIYPNVMTKVNLVDKEIYYQLPEGKEMVSTTPIQDIIFRYPMAGSDSITLSGLDAPLNSKSAPAYIVCAEGKIMLLKRITITYKDNQEYGTSNVIRSFNRKESFESREGNGPAIKLPKDEYGIVQLMSDKRKEITRYIDSNKLNLRNEMHLILLFKYYNSLFSEN